MTSARVTFDDLAGLSIEMSLHHTRKGNMKESIHRFFHRLPAPIAHLLKK